MAGLRLPLLLGASLLAGLWPAAARRGPAGDPPPWQSLVTARDRVRLKDWRNAWIDGLTQARAGGFAPPIDREGALLDPDAALDDPAPPDGDYRCRTIKLGVKGALGAAFSATGQVPCRVAGRRFETLAGAQRASGLLLRYDGARLLFLGAIVLGDERGAFPYSRDPERDSIGLMERIATARWRLVLPRPRWEAQIAVIEIVPAGG